MLIFGDAGCGSLFGLWMGDRDHKRFPSPVVQVGGIFEDDCMALVATNFLSFLIAETTIDALMKEDAAVIDKLQLPRSLKESEVVSDAEIRCWADLSFPETPSDPYESRLDAAALRELLAG